MLRQLLPLLFWNHILCPERVQATDIEGLWSPNQEGYACWNQKPEFVGTWTLWILGPSGSLDPGMLRILGCLLGFWGARDPLALGILSFWAIFLLLGSSGSWDPWALGILWLLGSFGSWDPGALGYHHSVTLLNHFAKLCRAFLVLVGLGAGGGLPCFGAVVRAAGCLSVKILLPPGVFLYCKSKNSENCKWHLRSGPL